MKRTLIHSGASNRWPQARCVSRVGSSGSRARWSEPQEAAGRARADVRARPEGDAGGCPQDSGLRTSAAAGPANGRGDPGSGHQVLAPAEPPALLEMVCASMSRSSGLPNRVRERLKVIRRWTDRLGDLQPDDLPAQRRSQPCRVPGAQVVAVRFGVGRERAEHGGRLRVDVGERRNRRLTAGGPGASAKRAHEREG